MYNKITVKKKPKAGTNMNFRSIKFKIPAFFTLYLLILLIVGVFMVVDNVQNNALEEKLSKNSAISELVSKKIDLYLASALKEIETSTKYTVENLNEDYIYYEINRLVDNYDYFDLVFFTSTEGRMMYSKPYNPIAIEKNTYTDRDYYQHIMRYRESFISKLYISRVLGKPHFVVAAPVQKGEYIYGLMAGGIPLAEMKNVIIDSDVVFNGGIWVVDSFGSLIVNPYEELKTDEIVSMENNKITINEKEYSLYEVLEKKITGTGLIERNNKTYYVSITHVDNADLAVLVEQEEQALLGEAFQVVNDMRGLVLILLGIGIVIALILSLGITKPIQNLVFLVRKWSEGDNRFDEVKIDSKSEIGELTETFKNITKDLDMKVEELKTSIKNENQIKQYLNNILMSAGSGIIVIDSKDEIVIFNREAEEISGYRGENLLGKKYEYFSNKIHIDFKKIIGNIEEKGDKLLERETVLINKNKKSIPCRIICSVIKNEEKNKIGYVFLINNIEVIKMLEEEIKREDRLNIVGEFSSSIIHDIGNPLAGLSNLLELYKSDIADKNEKEEILNLIEEEIEDLNSIVLNFLNFTKSKNQENIEVDICQIVNESVNILRSEMINSGIKVKINQEKEKIYLNIDRRSIKQALINIIKNSIQAIKGEGYINIKINELKEAVKIIIQDTGVGIKEDEMKNIFEPFYTTKKDGTGLGLSTSYKYIRDNDGKIEINSKYGEGTEFIITIPKRRKK
jgi:PAS domain S-box-containing protein